MRLTYISWASREKWLTPALWAS